MGIDVCDFPDTVRDYFESINSIVDFQKAFDGGLNNPFINDLRKVWREELERQIIENETPIESSLFVQYFKVYLDYLMDIHSNLYYLLSDSERYNRKNKYITDIQIKSARFKKRVESDINELCYLEYYKSQVKGLNEFLVLIGVNWSISPIGVLFSSAVDTISNLSMNADRNQPLKIEPNGPITEQYKTLPLTNFINRDFLCASRNLVQFIPNIQNRNENYGYSLEFQVFKIDGYEYIVERDETGSGSFIVFNFEFIDKWLKRYAFLLSDQKLINKDDHTVFDTVMHKSNTLDLTFIEPVVRNLQGIIKNIHDYHRPPFDPKIYNRRNKGEVLLQVISMKDWWEYDIYDKFLDSWNGFWLNLRTALNKMNIGEFIKFKDILVSEISRYNIESASNGFYLGNNPWGIDLLEMPSKIDSFCTNDVNQKISLEMLKVNQTNISYDGGEKVNNSFNEELATLRKSENKFNKGIPMDIVVSHFLVLTQKKGRDNNPILSEENFLQFIKLGFLDQSDIKPQKFNCESSQKGRIIKLFYGFYDIAVSDYRLVNKTEPFIDLILKCFTNWDRSSIKAFFKRNKVKGVL